MNLKNDKVMKVVGFVSYYIFMLIIVGIISNIRILSGYILPAAIILPVLILLFSRYKIEKDVHKNIFKGIKYGVISYGVLLIVIPLVLFGSCLVMSGFV